MSVLLALGDPGAACPYRIVLFDAGVVLGALLWRHIQEALPRASGRWVSGVLGCAFKAFVGHLALWRLSA
jgi:hypothetical protein